jgi:hypothetical protein
MKRIDDRPERTRRALGATLVSCGLLALALLVIPERAAAEASAETATCHPQETNPTDPTLTRARWLAPGRLQVVAGVGEGLKITVTGRVNFGPFRSNWTAATFPIGSEGVRVLDIQLPAQAFLHPLASTYLADLLVRVDTTDGEGRPRQEVALDPLYVAWPGGQGTSAVIWDEETHPPHWVLDPRLQAAASKVGPDARLGPPLGRHPAAKKAPEIETTGEDTPLSEQLPADPNDEETF